ncbi:cyclin-dependent protein kinase [Borealophlyctis nickersoniae]|nr:cyclin-dependent protein kinase [Borealophlyctis nickersoniae]
MRQSHASNLKNVYLQNASATSEQGFKLLASMLEYDPEKRITAEDALSHPYFEEDPKPGMNAFILPATDKKAFEYPSRKVQQDDKAKAPSTSATSAQRAPAKKQRVQ